MRRCRTPLVAVLALAMPAVVAAQGRYAPQGAAQRSFNLGERALVEAAQLREKGDTEGADEKLEEAAELFGDAVDADPAYMDAYVKLGLAYYTLGQPKKAIPRLEEAHNRDRSNPEIMFWLGNNLLRANRPSEAVRYLERVAAETDAFPEVFLVLGKHYYSAKALKRARLALERYVSLRPDDVNARGTLGNTYFKLKRYQDALKEFETVERLAPGNISVQVNIGNCHYQLGNYEKAVSLLEGALEKAPDRPSVLFNLAQSYFQLKQFERALTHYRRFLTLQPSSFNGHYFAGSALMALGRDGEALTELRAAARLRPKLVHPPYKIGLIHLRAGRSDEAEKAFLEAQRIKQGDAWILSGLGTVERQRRRYAKAIELQRRALIGEPSSARLHANLALTYLRAEKIDEAQREMDDALRLDPADAWVRQTGATVLAASSREQVRRGEIQRARDLLERALVLRPADPHLEADLALVHVARADTEAALVAAGTARGSAPDLAVTRYALGRAELLAGRFAKAREAFIAAGQVEPTAATAAAEGAAALLAGELDAAVERLDAALKTYQRDPLAPLIETNRALAHLSRAIAAFKDRRGGAAARDLKIALTSSASLAPGITARARYVGAVLALRRGDGGTARAHLAKLRAIDTESRAGLLEKDAPRRHLDFLAAFAQVHLGRYDRAVPLLEGLPRARKRGSAEARLLRRCHEKLAERAYTQGDLDLAKKHALAARDLGHESNVDHNLAVLTYLETRGRRKKKAAAQIRKLAGAVPEAIFNTGVLAEGENHHREAYQAFRRYGQAKRPHSAKARELADAKQRIFGFK